MNMVQLIEKKRDGGILTGEEIAFFVDGVTDGTIPDYQISALLMAIYFCGLNHEETAALTIAMADSGDRVDLSRFDGMTVDKHSTGGVGDKTTLVVGPIAAALGCKVAKMSGRGLGHTGGTVDKLEAIPGFQTVLTPQVFFQQVEQIGLSIIGQSGNLAPADKKLYALRDVTGTVANHSLIAASIMSKKLAAGAHHIVLDVKTGSGAFMKTLEQAELVAQEMVNIGACAGRKTVALITNMDAPLGNMVGNAVEVWEAIQILRGQGPQRLTELCILLAAHMVQLCRGGTLENCTSLCRTVLQDGRALGKFRQMVQMQGGDTAAVDDPDMLLSACEMQLVYAEHSGYVDKINSETVGRTAMLLGVGRIQTDDPIDPAAGIQLLVQVGDFVQAGQPIARLYTSQAERLEEAQQLMAQAFFYSSVPVHAEPILYRTIQEASI